MSNDMSQESIGDLFMCVMQHMKCIEVRLDFSKALTTQKQKYALANATQKVRVAINHLCDLLGDSHMVKRVKDALNETDMLTVMILTEQLSRLPSDEDIEHVVGYIENYVNNKYGDTSTEVSGNGKDFVPDTESSQGSDAVL